MILIVACATIKSQESFVLALFLLLQALQTLTFSFISKIQFASPPTIVSPQTALNFFPTFFYFVSGLVDQSFQR